MKELRGLIRSAKALLFDFDGVIKESIATKGAALQRVFRSYGEDFGDVVMQHHIANPGMPRFEKIKLYLEILGISDDLELKRHVRVFEESLLDAVVNSVWVPGVPEFLEIASKKKLMFVLTAAPQYEIDEILKRLDLSSKFHQIYGFPTKKESAMSLIMNKTGLLPSDLVMFGDSVPDYNAAQRMKIPFIYRLSESSPADARANNGMQACICDFKGLIDVFE